MQHTPINRETSLGTIASEHPEAVNVFLKHDLDFCCGGKQTIAEACETAGLNEQELMDKLIATINPNRNGNRPWSERPLNELMDHIVSSYHEPLRELLPTLIILSERVEHAHGPTHGHRMTELREIAHALEAEMLQHLEDEEQRLFPMIRNGDSASIPETLDQLVADHEAVGDKLARIRELTEEYTLPEDACVTWRSFWWNLEKLEVETKQHIHLENNVLFPRALKETSEASAA